MGSRPVSRAFADKAAAFIDRAVADRVGAVVCAAGDSALLIDEILDEAVARQGLNVLPVLMRADEGELVPVAPASSSPAASANGALKVGEFVGTAISPWHSIAGAALVAASIAGKWVNDWRASRDRPSVEQDTDAWFTLRSLREDRALVVWIEHLEDAPGLLELLRCGQADTVVGSGIVLICGVEHGGTELPTRSHPLNDAAVLCRTDRAEWWPIAPLTDADLRSWLGDVEPAAIRTVAQFGHRQPAATLELWERYESHGGVERDDAGRWLWSTEKATGETGDIVRRLKADLAGTDWSAGDVMDLFRLAVLEGSSFTAADVAAAGDADPNKFVDLLDHLAELADPLVSEAEPHPEGGTLPWRYTIESPMLRAAASINAGRNTRGAKRLLAEALHRPGQRTRQRNRDLSHLAFLADEADAGQRLAAAATALDTLEARVIRPRSPLPYAGWLDASRLRPPRFAGDPRPRARRVGHLT